MLIKICFLFITFFFNDANSSSKIRLMYAKSVHDKNTAKLLLQSLNQIEKTPLVKGYIGATTMLFAKHAINPINKMRYFNEGKKLLDDAILLDKGNVELRFLRFANQVKAPKFLGYNKNIETDKRYILTNLKLVVLDKDLKKLITEFMLQQELNSSEKQLLHIN